MDPNQTPAEQAENTPSAQTPAQKEEAYYRRQFEKAQREIEHLKQLSEDQQGSVSKEIEQLQDELKSVRQTEVQLRNDLLKRDLCDKAGIPGSLRKYVNGADEESLQKAIDSLMEDFGIQKELDKKPGLPDAQTPGGYSTRTMDVESLDPLQKIMLGVQRSRNQSIRGV